jgi:hypothetical protein
LDAFNGVSKRLLEFKDYFTRSEVPRENSPRRLRLGGERRGEEAAWDHREEGASLHHGSSLSFSSAAGPRPSKNSEA